ncbi:MAG: hypothetical protein A3E82_07860 [Gammaproteobacteria bacterium RIFCSPHIGHO2_12_FULL_38_11]|nr:MAG: hypothetical protein A3E82_07860 [Gammaproteobacteria bacterium RIFCSPHIGHO2_12_FULL_38_11]
MITVETPRFYSSHGKLIDTLKKLGYPPSDGLCHGVACVAAQHHLSDDMKTFHQHIKFTTKNLRFSDKQPHNTRRFFDDIVIGQSPNYYPLIKNIAPIFKNNKTQNSITALSAIKNSQIKKYRGIKCRAHFTGAYSMFELRRYFDLLSENASSHVCTFALLISSPLHSIMIGFDAKKNKWVFVDANKLPQRNFEYYNSARLATETNRALSSSRCGNTIFSTQLLTTRDCDINANHFVAHLYRDERWKKLHKVSARKAKMSDLFNNTWLMQACAIEDEIGIVKSLLKQNVDIVQTNILNFSAMTYAISYGNKAIVNLLLNNGANADHPENDYLEFATQFGFYDIAKDLLSHGAKIHPDHHSPIFTAASQGDQRFIKLFKQYGYTGAGSSFDRFFSHRRHDVKPALSRCAKKSRW